MGAKVASAPASSWCIVLKQGLAILALYRTSRFDCLEPRLGRIQRRDLGRDFRFPKMVANHFLIGNLGIALPWTRRLFLDSISQPTGTVASNTKGLLVAMRDRLPEEVMFGDTSGSTPYIKSLYAPCLPSSDHLCRYLSRPAGFHL